MPPSPSIASTRCQPKRSAAQQPNQLADWAYQGLTIAAMLLLLASLLSFW